MSNPAYPKPGFNWKTPDEAMNTMCHQISVSFLRDNQSGYLYSGTRAPNINTTAGGNHCIGPQCAHWVWHDPEENELGIKPEIKEPCWGRCGLNNVK